MNNTKENSNSLNPLIKQKAQELFAVIESDLEHTHEDDLAELMAEEIGDFLKTAKGFDMLDYCYTLSKTESETAILGLEEAANKLNDEALYTLTRLYKRVLALSDLVNTPAGKRDANHKWRVNLFLSEAVTEAEKIEYEISGSWKFRAMCYREEIERLKQSSKEGA